MSADPVVPHPGPPTAHLPDAIRAAMIEHARTEYPNEMCGVIVGDVWAADGGRAVRWEPARNEAASPMRYVVHRDDIYRLTVETDDADEVFWGIAHSHVRSPAVPSPTDIGAAQYRDALYLLVSLDPAQSDPATGEPGVRAWRIVDGTVHEVQLTS